MPAWDSAPWQCQPGAHSSLPRRGPFEFDLGSGSSLNRASRFGLLARNCWLDCIGSLVAGVAAPTTRCAPRRLHSRPQCACCWLPSFTAHKASHRALQHAVGGEPVWLVAPIVSVPCASMPRRQGAAPASLAHHSRRIHNSSVNTLQACSGAHHRRRLQLAASRAARWSSCATGTWMQRATRYLESTLRRLNVRSCSCLHDFDTCTAFHVTLAVVPLYSRPSPPSRTPLPGWGSKLRQQNRPRRPDKAKLLALLHHRPMELEGAHHQHNTITGP